MQNPFKFPVRGLNLIFQGVFSTLESVGSYFFPKKTNHYLPKIMRQGDLAMLAALLLCVKIFSFSFIFLPSASAAPLTLTKENVFKLTNVSRAAYGLNPLNSDLLLAKAAQAKAEDMAKFSYFSHTSPQGKTPWQFLDQSGYKYLIAGENLAVNFKTAESMEDAWMNSASHKANILKSQYEEVGIGIAEGHMAGQKVSFVVQMFGVRAEQDVALTSAPTYVDRSGMYLVPQVAGAKISVLEKSFTEEKTIFPPVSVEAVSASLSEGKIKIQVKTQGPAVKVVASFGNASLMLDSKGQNVWEGYIDEFRLVKNSLTVSVTAYGANGEQAKSLGPNFSPSLENNFGLSDKTQPFSYSKSTSFLYAGKSIPEEGLSQQFYWLFISIFLTLLMLQIGIKPKIQHTRSIINSAFLVIFCVTLIM